MLKREKSRRWSGFLLVAFGVCTAAALDLQTAGVFVAPGASRVEMKAATMLREEIARRTQIRLPLRDPSERVPSIWLGTVKNLRALPTISAEKVQGLDAPEGFRIWTDTAQNRVIIAGADERGVLFGTGYLLRKLELGKQKIILPEGFQVTTAPRMKLRGHQLGYRQKTNSYDAWDVATWEQYLRDLAIFGCNAIELIPPRSDDDPDSPHFPLPPMEMMIEMSRLADEYGMDVWIWYPAMDPDYSNEKAVAAAVQEWGQVFRQLPRVDAVFVPGGDPGHTAPRPLFNLLEQQAANLHRYHPRATLWVSPQSFGSDWLEEFFDILRTEPPWLTGIVYGPQVRIPLAELRRRTPTRYPIRDYPDITHSRHCQYPVPDWDLAYAITEGREAINPRPTQMVQIFRATTLRSSIGFLTYSEGCNDDVNKAVWSGLGWDPDADPREILADYSRFFIGGAATDAFADLLLGLERNWMGALETNSLVEIHLQKAKQLERDATPQQKLNWRFQQALYRAYYDAFIQGRLKHETDVEKKALARLATAPAVGSLSALESADRLFDSPGVALDLRARLFELGEALFQSIRMQLSTERYLGEPGRGSNLNEIDQPLNNVVWLREQFAAIRSLPTEAERVSAIQRIVDWRTPGEGSFYDDLGDPRRQPHLLKGTGWQADPGFFTTPQAGFTDRVKGSENYPISWWHSAENLYDQPLRMQYSGLDAKATYKLRVVYGRYKNNAPTRLVANDETEIHGWLNRPAEILEFDLPAQTTAGGSLNLTWFPTSGKGGNGRVLDIAEVWLLKKGN